MTPRALPCLRPGAGAGRPPFLQPSLLRPRGSWESPGPAGREALCRQQHMTENDKTTVGHKVGRQAGP